MIRLELKNKKYELPTSFRELTLNKYQEIVKVDKDLKPLDRYVKIVNILTGIDEEIIRSIDIEQIKIIQNNISFIFASTDHLKLIDRFELDGVKYGFNNHLSSISFGEYIDLEEYSKKEEINDNLHILMAILYRPIKSFKKRTFFSYLRNVKEEVEYEIEKYKDEEVIERSELFKEKLSMDIVLGSMVFFSILKIATTYSLKGYSEKRIRKEMEKLMKKMMMTMEDLNQIG